MPATMMHLLSGKMLWQNGSDSFFLGNVIPDCVDRDRALKDKLHFRNIPQNQRKQQIADFSKENLDIENSDTDFGILWHFFLDSEWDVGPQKMHRESFGDGAYSREWFISYRAEIGLTAAYIMNSYPFANEIWDRIVKFSDADFDDKIGFPKNYVYDFLTESYSYHKSIPFAESKIFTPALCESFIKKSIRKFKQYLEKYYPDTKWLRLTSFKEFSMDKHIKIAVVCGGTSSEREVSLRSGKAVFDALCEYGFDRVSLFDLTENNFTELISSKPEICFLALHGAGGEDGSIQEKLEKEGIPYTFSGVKTSKISIDKIKTKELFVENGIPTAPFFVLKRASHEKITDFLPELAKTGYPLVLKAPKEGSSIGVVILKSEIGAAKALEEEFEFGDTVLCEKFLDGTEVTVPVIGNENPEALPVIEITAENEFYDYEAKYTPGMCHHIIPARISAEDMKKCEEIAVKAYKALGCRGVARLDMIIDKKSGVSVMEVNTIPGMTSMSLVPDSARAKGISFPDLCAKFISLALE